MIFDTWGGALSARGLPGVLAGLHAAHRRRPEARSMTASAFPRIVFTKGGGQWLEAIAAIGCDAVGLDWTTDLGDARRRVGDQVALQGNLDPMALFASPEAVAAEARRVLDSFGAHGAERPRLQSRPRHLPIHAAGQCRRAGRDGAPIQPRLSRRAARLARPRPSGAGPAGKGGQTASRPATGFPRPDAAPGQAGLQASRSKVRRWGSQSTYSHRKLLILNPAHSHAQLGYFQHIVFKRLFLLNYYATVKFSLSDRQLRSPGTLFTKLSTVFVSNQFSLSDQWIRRLKRKLIEL